LKLANKILLEVFVVSYYRLNVGFFLLIVLLGFGFMRGSDHWMLAQFFVARPENLYIPAILYALYQLKIVLFINGRVHLRENSFLDQWELLPFRQRINSIFKAAFLLNVPAMAYMLFIATCGLFFQAWNAAVLIMTYVLLFQGIATILGHCSLRRIPYEHRYSYLFYQVNRITSRKLWMTFAEWLIREEPVLLLLTKILSVLLLTFGLVVFEQSDFDDRFLNFTMLNVFIPTGIFTFHYIKFDTQILSWKRNLPVPMYQRFLEQMLSLLPLMIPELILLINWPLSEHTLFDKFTLFFYGFSFTSLLLNFQWKKNLSLSKLSFYLFWIYIAFIFIILFGVHRWIVLGFNYLVSVALAYDGYFKYMHGTYKEN